MMVLRKIIQICKPRFWTPDVKHLWIFLWGNNNTSLIDNKTLFQWMSNPCSMVISKCSCAESAAFARHTLLFEKLCKAVRQKIWDVYYPKIPYWLILHDVGEGDIKISWKHSKTPCSLTQSLPKAPQWEPNQLEGVEQERVEWNQVADRF